MQWPLTDPATLFEGLLQDLPPETAHMARAFKAFVRAKKVKTPEQRLRVVCLSGGLDKSLREVAGTFTALYEAITDQSVAERYLLNNLAMTACAQASCHSRGKRA